MAIVTYRIDGTPYRAHRPRLDGPEGTLTVALFDDLLNAGKAPQTQVPTRFGVIDILTDDAIYEVKATLSRHSLFTAAGQLLVYGLAYPNHTLRIIGRPGDGLVLIPAFKQRGIDVEVWDERDSGGELFP